MVSDPKSVESRGGDGAADGLDHLWPLDEVLEVVNGKLREQEGELGKLDTVGRSHQELLDRRVQVEANLQKAIEARRQAEEALKKELEEAARAQLEAQEAYVKALENEQKAEEEAQRLLDIEAQRIALEKQYTDLVFDQTNDRIAVLERERDERIAAAEAIGAETLNAVILPARATLVDDAAGDRVVFVRPQVMDHASRVPLSMLGKHGRHQPSLSVDEFGLLKRP